MDMNIKISVLKKESTYAGTSGPSILELGVGSRFFGGVCGGEI